MVTVGINGQLLQLHRTGQIRILAVTSEHRLQVAPEVPTAIEAGLPGMLADVFTALFVPIKTPRPIIDKIYRASQKVMADPSVQQTLIAQGLQPISDSSPEKTLAFLQSEIARWTPIIEKVGLKKR
jgi:tripartite-type tricarboxylate transporter receptor subunit TctC